MFQLIREFEIKMSNNTRQDKYSWNITRQTTFFVITFLLQKIGRFKPEHANASTRKSPT